MRNSHKLVLIILLIIVIAIGSYFLFFRAKSNTTSSVTNACTGSTYQIGSSGQCVADVQNMINFLETDSLNQCPFTGAARLNASGSFDAATEAQVKVVQTWLNCYNQQEGAGSSLAINGVVDQKVWPQLCTYAYTYPKQAKQSTSPYLNQSLSAGKSAGC
jgi:hypothetical protein